MANVSTTKGIDDMAIFTGCEPAGRPVGSGRSAARGAGRASLALALLASLLGVLATPASAGQSNHGQPTVQINPGGGQDLGGLDGLRILVNSDGTVSGASIQGQDQVHYRGQPQWCCGASAPMLSIGGSLYGEAGPAASSGSSWTSLQLVGVTGAARTQGETDTGSGTAHYRYTADHNGRNYVVDRMVSYTFPNNFFTDTYEITIPSGNTDVVKFYLGGDTSPGGTDTGTGVMLTSPVRTVYSVNPSSQIQIGFAEMAGSTPFDGATSQSFVLPYSTVQSGGDIGFVADSSSHDAGLMMQWNLGATPGTYDRALRHIVGPQGTSLAATLRSTETEAGEEVLIDFEATNTAPANNTDIDFRFQLPTGLAIGSTTPTNSCGGTLSAPAGGSTVELANGTVNAATSCVITVAVVGANSGSYQYTSASVTLLGGMTNGVGSSTLIVNAGPGACPADHGWDVIVDQASRLYLAALGRSADASGRAYWVRLRLAGMTPREMALQLLASTERDLTSGTQTDAQFVEELYQDVLGRASDSGGLAYWVNQLGAGLDRAALVVLFSDSAEHVTRTSTRAAMTDNQALICRLYETIFLRSPDDDGFNYWRGLLDDGTSPRQVVALMLTTTEGSAVADLPAASYVDRLYQGALNRTGDSGGLTYWENLLGVHGRAAVAIWLANVHEA